MVHIMLFLSNHIRFKSSQGKGFTNFYYYPFGMGVMERGYTSGVVGYRFGFNGQEKDDEVSGNGNSMTAEFWQYDTRVCRRWNLDPVPKHNFSNYSVLSNSPLIMIDPKGNADYYHKRGKWIGTDGVDNNLNYVVTSSKTERLIKESSKKGKNISLDKTTNNGLLKVPELKVRETMNAQLKSTYKTNVEHGGHSTSSGNIVEWDPGSGLKEVNDQTSANIYKRATVTLFQVNGVVDAPDPAKTEVIWHTHPTGGNKFPSTADYSIAETLKNDYHYHADIILIGPMYGRITYFQADKERGTVKSMKAFLRIGTEASKNSKIGMIGTINDTDNVYNYNQALRNHFDYFCLRRLWSKSQRNKSRNKLKMANPCFGGQ